MTRLLILLAWLALAMPASAAELLETIGAERPVQLKTVRVRAELSGQLAQTVYELSFYNPNGRQLEGQLNFPLLEGQQISGFALDFNQEFRPAVPVDKARGRQIFEETVRRQVDPALLEHTGGNQFRLRVYPIPALGERRVQITVSEVLHPAQGGLALRLPLQFAKRVADFRLSIGAQGVVAAPQLGSVVGALRFSQDNGVFHADSRSLVLDPQGEFVLHVRPEQKAQVYTQRFDGDTYFIATVPVKEARSQLRPLTAKPVGLLWDSSSSGAQRQIDKELALLDRYFKALAARQPQFEVRLQRLREQPEAVETYRIAKGDWSKLRSALQNTAYDGATRMAFVPEAAVGEYLLFSDGLVNYGDDRVPTLGSGQKLFAISSAAGADTDRLAALASRSRGALVDLTAGLEAATHALLDVGASLNGPLTGEGADQIVIRSEHAQDGQFLIAGRLTAARASLRGEYLPCATCAAQPLSLEMGKQTHDSAVVALLWASLQMAQLNAEPEFNRGQIRRLGQRFGLPSRETSLIALDRVEDYVQHDVIPPAALRADFDRLRAARGQQSRRDAQRQIDKLANLFKARVAWWEKDYSKEDLPPVRKAKIAMRERDEAPMAQMALAPAPAAAPVAESAKSARSAVAESAQKSVSSISDKAEVAEPQIGISLRKWTPDTPYLKRMKTADDKDLYRIYLDEKPSWANSSAFYLDVADLFVERGQKALALRILSNLAEMELENRQVLRLLAYRLLQWKAPALAVPVLQEVQRLSEEEPQSFRDLALAYAAAGQYALAVEQFKEVLQRAWDDRFAEIDLVALGELNALLAAHPELDKQGIDPRLIRNLPLDMRVVLSWDADNSDMDLWVTDPNGEKCFYAHRYTYQGGHMSRDFTGGYGPEEFLLKKAKPGKYKVEANFYGNRQQIVAGATSLQLSFFTGYGTPKQKEENVTLRLKGNGETVFVGEFVVK